LFSFEKLITQSKTVFAMQLMGWLHSNSLVQQRQTFIHLELYCLFLSTRHS